jgi:proprotein convertase subtilisin/kexin type 2
MYLYKKQTWLTAGLLLALTACGGGSGDAPAVTPVTPVPPFTPVPPVEPVAKTCAAVTSPGDPLYSDQWHLKNTGSPTGTAGEDTNVESVWSTICGLGVTIAIIDDGLDIRHEDLAANVVDGSKNYVNNTTDPTPPAGSTDSHGTSVAGIAAAVGFNDIGVRGVAPGAQLIGLNSLQTGETADEADAVIRGDVSNSSIGPADDGTLHVEGAIVKAAIEDGITNRRGGKGIVYFRAAGNGRGATSLMSDYSNYDGTVNLHGVNVVAALNDDGKQASYSESGSNILISTHSGESCDSNTQTTVDVTGTAGSNNAGTNTAGTDYPNDNYTQCFNGTSGATPVASGVAALVLQANPNLTRRDVRLLLARTARKNDPADADWAVNGAGMSINHKYGFGAIDAAAAVVAAGSWTLLPAEKTPGTKASGVLTVAIPDGTGALGVYGAAATNTINIATSAITMVEFVDVTFASDHSYWLDLEITLTSPSGTKSVLTEAHYTTKAGVNITPTGTELVGGVTFSSVRHTDEGPVGDWTISVRDGGPGDNGNITSWSIKLYGR